MKSYANIILICIFIWGGCVNKSESTKPITMISIDYQLHSGVPVWCGAFGVVPSIFVDTITIDNMDIINRIAELRDSIIINSDTSNYIDVRFMLLINNASPHMDTVCAGGYSNIYYKSKIYEDDKMSLYLRRVYDEIIE